jgi:hypothetical protein
MNEQLYASEKDETLTIEKEGSTGTGNGANGGGMDDGCGGLEAVQSQGDEQVEGTGNGELTAPFLTEREEIFEWGDDEVEPWTEPVDGVELIRGLSEFLKRYVVLGQYAAETLALWVVHTYGFRLRDVTTYIGIESPQKRCGKTTLLTVLGELVNRPVVASNISSPAFFRVISEKQPTLMIDEADTVLNRNDELRGILNAGYRRKTAYVVRVAAEPKAVAHPPSGRYGATSPPTLRKGATRLARYSSWCPKAIATIKHLPETLADRCIVLTLHRKKVEEKCERTKDLDGTELRRKCARFVRDHAQAIGQARPEIPGDLNDRAAEIWEPLLAVADLAGGEWPKLAREAAVELTGSRREETAMGALLFDILVSFAKGESERMFSRTLVAELNRLGERPWGEMKKGKEITEAWLARQLRPYEVSSKSMWIDGESAKGYEMSDLEDAFQRYIPKGQARRMLAETIGAAAPAAEKSEGPGAKAEGESEV